MASEDLQSEIETHRDVYASLTGTGRRLLGSLSSQEDAVMLQRRLDEMNQRWHHLKAKSMAIRERVWPSGEDAFNHNSTSSYERSGWYSLGLLDSLSSQGERVQRASEREGGCGHVATEIGRDKAMMTSPQDKEYLVVVA
ncbi:unnamed protein product [Chilo suppressalis]|uniref:Dystrophin n=1 Tax=Chilo suppressalis TaxID=168631 RepID=A0ABN8B4S3_CHISP|nr:unnamed protein product [Chilo suppressalis]